MVFDGWYTDKVTVYRTENTVVDYVTVQSEKKVEEYPCRIYRSSKGAPRMSNMESSTISTEVMAVRLGADIKSGDKLMITRGASMGQTAQTRYYAGEIMPYFEPVGGMFNGLAHIEVGLLQEEVI